MSMKKQFLVMLVCEKNNGIAYEQPDSLAAVSKEADADVRSLLHIERSGAASGMGADRKLLRCFSDDVLLGKTIAKSSS